MTTLHVDEMAALLKAQSCSQAVVHVNINVQPPALAGAAPRWEDYAQAIARRLRGDYARCLAEAGITHEQVQFLMESEPYAKEMPEGFEHLTLGPSPIEGTGLFTRKAIDAGEVIGPARIGTVRTLLGGFANHSPFPNTAFRVTPSGDLESVALRQIPAGAEIVNNYRQGMALTGVRAIPEEVEMTRVIHARHEKSSGINLVRACFSRKSTG